MLRKKIERVQARILAAANRSKRSSGEIRLLAVTKGVSVEKIRRAIDVGLHLFGESRVEEAAQKIPQFPQVEWHLVGHLQSRKAKEALPLFNLIHSVDSLKLLQVLERQAALSNQTVPLLLEINVAKEETKYGFSEENFWATLPLLATMPHLKVEGLMTLPPLNLDPEASRPYFRRLRLIFEAVRKKGYSFLEMRTLSMGMSQDFEVAVEEGSNLVRVGSAIFADN